MYNVSTCKELWKTAVKKEKEKGKMWTAEWQSTKVKNIVQLPDVQEILQSSYNN